jgi:hypothetical protein
MLVIDRKEGRVGLWWSWCGSLRVVAGETAGRKIAGDRWMCLGVAVVRTTRRKGTVVVLVQQKKGRRWEACCGCRHERGVCGW